MSRKLVIMTAAALVVFPTLAAAADKPGTHFQRYQGTARSIKPATLARRDHKPERVTVVVQMSGDSVATARAQTVDHKISDDQRNSVRQRAALQQSAIEPEIVARGGRVLARYQDALNGVKIEIDSDQVEALKSASGVLGVLPVRQYHMDNATSVPFIGAPQAWQNTGFRGEKIKVAIIDTGIDYTHANFGGPGTVAAFEAAAAASTQPADPKLFGPKAPKVKGGIDLVGDDYNASADPDTNPEQLVPHPDPNPLDCNGHGSHTAGTAAGLGVANDGTTYNGPYNSAAYAQGFSVGPGVAPKADLYAIRVFGCEGSTNVVVDAIDWAIHHDIDVINMSLGSDFGTAQDADAIAAADAARAGVIVVASSGNEGPAPYITGTPAASATAISVAAIDSHDTFPGASIVLDNGTIQAIDANGAPLPGNPLQVVVLSDGAGGVSLGCDEAEYVDSLIQGKLVVTLRGVCARVDRATFGQRHGAAAVAMINTDPGFPPFEGPIPNVTIPFLGVPGGPPGDTLAAATTATSFTAITISNPAFRNVASFSSGGPRFGDSMLKPNVSAPGVSIVSTGVGTGNQGAINSGTSMAAPHVAGVAALAVQAHPKWDEGAVRAAIVQTADPKALNDYTPALEGSGLVQPLGATQTQAVVFAEGKGGSHAVSFGFEEFMRNFRAEQDVRIHNYGDSPVVFNVTSTRTGGVPHKLQISDTSVRLGGRDEEKIELTLTVPVDTVGGTTDAEGNQQFQEVAGYLTFTPANPQMNNGVSLHVPYYMVPRARANVLATLTDKLDTKHPNSRVLLANLLGATTGSGDFYAWGLSGKRQGISYFDTRAVGVQSNPISATDSILVFSVNTFDRFSNASLAEFDIDVDTNGDGVADFIVVGADLGALTTGIFNGQYAAAVYRNAPNATGVIRFLAIAPTDGSSILLPVLASDLGLSPAKPRFSYGATVFNLSEQSQATLPGRASFNVFTPAISNALFVPVAPNKLASVPVSINPTEWAQTPALGLMVTVQDNNSGERQATLIPVKK